MKKAQMNISHSRFILFKLKIFGEIVTTYFLLTKQWWLQEWRIYQHTLKARKIIANNTAHASK